MASTSSKDDWIDSLLAQEDLPADYATAVHDFIAPLASRIQAMRGRIGHSVVVGICGAQGSGKSTFAMFLANCLARQHGVATVCLSLDDLYLGKAERQALARRVHPLFVTRGVPGTHDLEQGNFVLDRLVKATGPGQVPVPAFDKAVDDRIAESAWPTVTVPADVILFEGWCVGATAQADDALVQPVNQLEAQEDPVGLWRRYVNRCLQTSYADFFSRLDALVMLRVPSFEKVFEWRRLQEHKLRAKALEVAAVGTAMPRGQTDAELERFIQHYERLTRHMLATMPGHADTLIDIDDNHRMTSMVNRGRL